MAAFGFTIGARREPACPFTSPLPCRLRVRIRHRWSSTWCQL